MSFDKVKLHLLVFCITFVILTVVGLISDVSLGASFSRGLYGGLVFGIITFSLHNILSLTVLNFKETSDADEDETSSTFDFKIDDDGVSGLGDLDSSMTEETDSPSFQPFEAKQVDPLLSKMINEDPKRAAELIRKMGLDE